MSRTAAQLAQTEEEMKIQHITHDESRDELPHINKRLSASMKVRSFISRRISQTFNSPPLGSHHEEDSNNSRPITLFPRFGESKHSLAEESPEMTGYLVQKHRVDKATKKQEKIILSANSSRSYLPLKSPTGSSSRSKRFTIPSRKKKGTFSDLVKEKLYRRTEPSNGNSKRTAEDSAEKSDKMIKAYNLRKAMMEGKLERVVPPPSTAISSGQNRRPPPRPVHNPFLDHISSPSSNLLSPRPRTGAGKNIDIPSSRTSLSHARPTSRTRKTKSASSKIANLIGSSADMLDKTRREIQCRFREPFEHLNYPSFSLARRADDDDDDDGDGDADSDESFFCLGDVDPGPLPLGLGVGTPKRSEREFYDMPRPKTRGKGSERGESRLSSFGRGRERDAQVPPEEVKKKCRLCGLGIAVSMRGLCVECEADFQPLNPQNPTLNMQIPYSDSEYEDDIVVDDDTEDDIPPTLPLKIRKQEPVRQELAWNRLTPDAYKQRNPFAFEDSESDDERPPVPPKDDIILDLSLPNKTYKPSITAGDPTRQGSQQARVELQTEPEPEPQSAIDRLTGWQSDGVDSPTYEEAKGMLERWSDCFEEGSVECMREVQEDGVPLVRAMDCDGVKRDSEFYRFWDGVLKEHAPNTTRGLG